MSKKIFTTIIVLLGILGMAHGSTNYGVKVAGIEVSSDNYDNVTGGKITLGEGGYVKFSGSKSKGTLRLKNVTISREGSGNRAILNYGNEDLTIIFEGETYLYARDAAPVRTEKKTTIKCENGGKVTIEGDKEDAICPYNDVLSIRDADLTLKATNSRAIWSDGTGTVNIYTSNIMAYGLKGAVVGLKRFYVNRSYVTLNSGSNYRVMSEVPSYGSTVSMEYTKPIDAHYDATLQTIVSGAYSDGVKYELIMKPTAIAINETNFPDENFRAWVLSSCDTSGNGYLTLYERSRQQYIDVSSKGIKSLTGIELFYEALSINCSDNNLTTLDLTANTKMTHLYCNKNELTAINLPDKGPLRGIKCACNKLNGQAMMQIINKLTPNNGAYIDAIYNENEQNIFTQSHLDAINDLYWTASYWDGALWQDITYGCWLNSTNFPDAKFLTWAKELDANATGWLEPQELAIRKMDVRDMNIASLKGIHFFTKLDSLNCLGNKLTSLSPDKNYELTFLNCSKNPNLSTLNVMANKKLKKLSCYSCNLSSLDVSYNKELTFLSCSVNDLSSLDLKTNTKLTYVECDQNALTELDLAKNAQITTLYCYGNQLTSLNMPNSVYLKKLYCYNNQLASLDLSKCTALEELVCSHNPLTALDVSKNTKLTRLNCGWCQLTTLDATTCNGSLRCNNNQLTSLTLGGSYTLISCHNNRLVGEQMAAVMKAKAYGTDATLYVFDAESTTEQNVCTKADVMLASPSWTVLCRTDSQESGQYLGYTFHSEDSAGAWWIYPGSGAVPTGIEAVAADGATPAYNLKGQRVGSGYRGIVVTEGKKVLRK